MMRSSNYAREPNESTMGVVAVFAEMGRDGVAITRVRFASFVADYGQCWKRNQWNGEIRIQVSMAVDPVGNIGRRISSKFVDPRRSLHLSKERSKRRNDEEANW